MLNTIQHALYTGISPKILCEERQSGASWSSAPGSCLSAQQYVQYCASQGKVFKVISRNAYCIYNSKFKKKTYLINFMSKF